MNLQVHCDLIKGVATCTVTRPSEHPINSWGPDSSIWLVFQLIYFLSYIPERMIPIDFFGSNQKMSRVQNRWLIKQSYTCNKQYWLGIIVIQCNSIGNAHSPTSETQVGIPRWDRRVMKTPVKSWWFTRFSKFHELRGTSNLLAVYIYIYALWNMIVSSCPDRPFMYPAGWIKMMRNWWLKSFRSWPGLVQTSASQSKWWITHGKSMSRMNCSLPKENPSLWKSICI